MTTPASDQQALEVMQEPDRVASRKVIAIFCAALLVVMLSVIVSGWILNALRPATNASSPAAPQPAPRQIAAIHQTLIARDRHGWQQREQARASLERCRWIDRGAGLAEIPIERAITLIADRAPGQGGGP